MVINCSQAGIVNIKQPRQGILDIKRAEFESMFLDMSVCCTGYELENTGDNKLKKANKTTVSEDSDKLQIAMEPMLNKIAAEKMKVAVAIAPYLCRDTKREDLNTLVKRLAEESIRVCGRVGCHYLVVRPLFAGICKSDIWNKNREYYLSLAQLAKENSVEILLENQCREVNGHLIRGLCSDGREAAEWVDELNREAGENIFGFCMNVGTCNLCGQNMYDFALALNSRLKAVILRDCDGDKENAMLLFTCVNKHRSQTDWLNLIRGLRVIEFDGQLVIDMEDTAAAFSPILRPALLQLAKAVGDYFKWQIGIEKLLKSYSSIVLFGAGNMCRNYMKCYGEKYPPLFTCDNNKALWGTSFCGLEVKAPECLRELPRDSGIFICNIYYREIEQQLREMEIENPIEIFNDEYMPTYYFDRLEDRGEK